MSRRAWVQQIMGMPISIHLRGDDVDSPVVGAGVAEAFDLLRETDRLFGTHRQDSEVKMSRIFVLAPFDPVRAGVRGGHRPVPPSGRS